MLSSTANNNTRNGSTEYNKAFTKLTKPKELAIVTNNTAITLSISANRINLNP